MSASSVSDTNSEIATLDVLGVGVSIEMFQQYKIIRQLHEHPKGSILPTMPQAYTTDNAEKELTLKRRGAYVLAAAVEEFVQNWDIPSVCVWPGRDKEDMPEDDPLAEFFADHLASLMDVVDMSPHTTVPLTPVFLNEPADILKRAFRFFDAYPDVPALLLFATDSEMTRLMVGDMSHKEHWREGRPRRFDSLAETVVAILLARPDRVDKYLRPYAGSRATHLYPAGPTKPGFTPGKYLPEAWTAEQIDQFDDMQTIAVLHRPIEVSYRRDENGKPTADPKKQASIMPSQAQQTVFKEKFEIALQSIPGGEPARILYDTGGPATGAHVVPLSLAMNDMLPEMDFSNPDDVIDMSLRIGNSGAASPLALWALAALMSGDQNDVSMTVNLRKAEEATITVVTPGKERRPKAIVQAPVGASRPVAAFLPPPVRRVPIGMCLRTEDECPQSGYWQCVPADVLAGDKHYIREGQSFPPVRGKRILTVMEKMMNESPVEAMAASWTLVSYD